MAERGSLAYRRITRLTLRKSLERSTELNNLLPIISACITSSTGSNGPICFIVVGRVSRARSSDNPCKYICMLVPSTSKRGCWLKRLEGLDFDLGPFRNFSCNYPVGRRHLDTILMLVHHKNRSDYRG